MTKPIDFTNFAIAYPRYFAGQFLLEDDFELQHKYLSDRQKYYMHSLHVSGIIEGLEVEVTADNKAVKIKPGSAINNKGELIVIKQDISSFSDFKKLTSGELYIKYDKKEQVKQQEDFTRWQENPEVGFESTAPENAVKLAKLTISGDTITEIEPSVREYSGLSLPNSNSKALTLRSEGSTNSNLAVLTGSLKIDGSLTVNSTEKSSFAGSLTVSGSLGIGTEPGSYKLNIQGNQNINGDLTVNGTGNSSFAGNLTVTGAITPSAGNTESNGIMFPKNPGGGTEDAAWIRYYRRGNTGEATTFEIGTLNDFNDHISLMPSGGVGIGTRDPGDYYKLNVQGNQLLNGNLRVEGKLTSGNSRIYKEKSNEINCTSNDWVDMPDMIAEIDVSIPQTPVLILFKIGGVQSTFAQTLRAKFQILIDDREKAFTTHEFHNKGWELRDVSLTYLATLEQGKHFVKVQWHKELGDFAACGYGSTRNLIVIEL